MAAGNFAWIGSGVTISSITDDKSNSYTVEDTTAVTSNFASFYALNLTNGPSKITVTLSGASTFLRMVSDEFSGIATSAALDQHALNTLTAVSGANSITSGNVTTAQSGELIYGGYKDRTGVTVVPGTGFIGTENGLVGDNENVGAEYLV
jgi:hypothetical protein